VDLPTYLLSGMLPWITFGDSMAKRSSVIVGRANVATPTSRSIECACSVGMSARFVKLGFC